MKSEMKGLSLGALGALLLCVAPAARAQDSNTIGNPQLRDFQLRPQQPQQPQPLPQQPIIQPRQQAPAPVVVAPPPPVTTQPQTPPSGQQQPAPQAQRTQPGPATPAQRQPVQTQPQIQPQAPGTAPIPQAAPPSATEPLAPAAPAPLPPASAPPGQETGPAFPWLYLVAAGALAMIGLALLLRRRRRRAEEDLYEEALEAPIVTVAVAEPEASRPEPASRPWLELSLKAERASATLTETVVNFELEIANSGKGAARNLRIDVKMFNAGAEQDKEIGAFFRTAGRESTKLNLPGIAPESVGVINAQVAMPRDEMRAVVLEEKYLFVPVIAVNALYDWGEGRTGQSSKSYVVGRELEQPSEKMGAFRVDQGPRVWRTVGQRQHSLARRV
jgi:LPXTG-motif cell wall-anchored protein